MGHLCRLTVTLTATSADGRHVGRRVAGADAIAKGVAEGVDGLTLEAESDVGVDAGGDADVGVAEAWKHTGRPSDDNWNRHRPDVARAHARTGDLTTAMDELAGVRHASPEWLRHQRMAAETMQEILKKRKCTLTSDMREVADHLGVVG